jgi:hypothetical protein
LYAELPPVNCVFLLTPKEQGDRIYQSISVKTCKFFKNRSRLGAIAATVTPPKKIG